MMTDSSKPCLIACGIFKQEMEKLVDKMALNADLHFLNPGLHNDPKKLEMALRKSIEKYVNNDRKSIIVVYGDVCLGFNGEIKKVVETYDVIKVDGLNCIDCLLGGKGKLLEIDPKHEYFFLNPAWIALEFGNRDKMQNKAEARKEFSSLKGLFLLDTLGNLDDYEKEIEDISDFTGLPFQERRNVGISGIQSVIMEAIQRSDDKSRCTVMEVVSKPQG